MHKVKIVDMRADLLSPADVVKEFSLFKPDVVGISSFTVEESMLHKVAKAIKEEKHSCPVVSGGPHANACSEDVLGDANIDYCVLGEGELTFPKLIKTIMSGEDNVYEIKGIAFRVKGEIIKTPPEEYVQNLDELPFPGWDSIDLKKYFKLPRFMPFIPHGGKPYMSLITSRGCPFSCIYCHNILGKRFRMRSPENVFSEIEVLYQKYGISDFEFIDDCFNLNPKRVIAICDLIIESGLKLELSFPNGLRGDLLNEEVLEKLRSAGTKIIVFAPETGSARLQKVIGKNMNLEKLQKMISLSAKLGIHAHGFFMLGFPTETKEDLNLTLRFIKGTRLHTADFFIVNIFPDTELYKQTKAMGKKVPEKFDNIDYHDASFNVSDVSAKELLACQRKFFTIFYLNPVRILRILSRSAVKKRYLLYYIVIFLRLVVLRKRQS